MHSGRFDSSSNSHASSSQVAQSITASSGAKRKKTGSNRTQKKPTGKKATTSFSSTGTLELEMTEENMAIYKAMQAKLKQEKRTAAATHDEGKLF